MEIPVPQMAAGVIEVCGICHSGCPVPVCLVTCGHRFCLGCLEAFWKSLPEEKPCPTCRPARGAPPQLQHEEDGAERSPGARRCPEHRDRLLELYCARCRLCICTLCPLLGTHTGHPVSLIQQEAAYRKDLSNRCLEHLDQKRSYVLGNIQHIEQAATELKAQSLTSKDSVTSKFTEMRLLFDEEERLAKKCIDDKAKMTLWAYDGQVESCLDHIKAIDTFSSKVRTIYQQSDPVQLIQDYAASEKEIKNHLAPAEQWHPVPVTFNDVEDYYSSFIEGLKSTFKESPLSRIQKDAFNRLKGRSTQKPGTLIKTRSFVDRLLFLKHARCPSLDPDTMHPKLRLSADQLTVYCTWLSKFNASHPPRFDRLMQIMSRDAYSSGAHYWEVDLLKAGQGWWIGITYPSIQRKGDTELSRLGWNSGSWCIKRFDNEYWAFHKGERKAIRIGNPPEKVGVFLDYEAGVLSFFDVTAGMGHLHTFRCRFTEPLYPAMRMWEGSITVCRLT